MITNRKRVFLYSGIILAMALIWVLFAYFQYSSYSRYKKLEYEEQFTQAETNIRLSINESTIFIYGLKGFTESQIPLGITNESFNTFSKEVLKTTTIIKNFSIAPDNIQTYVYPIEGNEETIGHNLATDQRENVRKDIERAMETKDIVISGPYELRQGGLGVIIRAPIFRDNNYWGMINVAVNIDEIIKNSKILTDYKDLNITLSNENDKIFYGKAEDNDAVLYESEILFLDNKWTLSANYLDTYNSSQDSRVKIILGTSFFVFILITIFLINSLYKNYLLSESVQRLIYHDTLTSLRNRRDLVKKLDEYIKNSIAFSIAFIDLDDFKNVNDTLGHSTGDKLLREIGTRLLFIEDEDIQVYRWGGDEFIIVLTGKSNILNSEVVIAHILNDLKEVVIVEKEEFSLAFSIGVSSYPNDGQSYDDVIKHADIAMYHAKNSGKNRLQVYNKDVGNKYYDGIDFEKRLMNALENNQIMLYYQPQVEIATGKVIAVEALIRWRDSEGQWISPGVFIPIAEKLRLMDYIDEFVINSALNQLKTWKEKDISIRISINISAKQFRKELALRILSQMEELELNPSYLEIELTERLKLEDIDKASEVIKIFREAGVRIALDDFGAGYSSLTYLSKLNVTSLKIDYDLISRIKNDSYKIVKSIIALSKDYNLDLIAEGVEEIQQLKILEEMGCGYYQGFYFSKAVDALEIEKYF